MGSWFSKKPVDPCRVVLVKRSQYELVMISIPVFVAAGLNNLVSSIIKVTSDASAESEPAEIGQQFLYTFIISYTVGKFLFYHFAEYIDACRSSRQTTVFDPCGVLQWCKRNKLLTLFARILNENASFSIKEFMLLLLVEQTYELYGFGSAFGGCIFAFGLFCIIIASSIYITTNWMHMKTNLVEWLADYDIDAFGLGVGAMFIAIIAKGTSEQGFKFISQGSVLYGPEAESDDDVLTGNASSFNILFTFGITFWCGVLLCFEDLCRHKSVDLEYKDEFAETLAIVPPESERHNEDDRSVSVDGSTTRPSHHHRESVWEICAEAFRNYYHNILGCICGVAYFVFFTSSVLSWFGFHAGSPLLYFVGIIILTSLVSQRAPECLISNQLREKRSAKLMKDNNVYLDNAKATSGSYKASPSESSASAVPASDITAPLDASDTENGSESEDRSCCKRYCGNTASLYCSACLQYYYHVMVYRRRLTIVAVKLTVGWTWEVVVSSLLALITESIELTTSQEVGVRFAIMVMIIIFSAIVFYVFRNGDELYTIDLVELRKKQRETEMPAQSTNPLAPTSSAMER